MKVSRVEEEMAYEMEKFRKYSKDVYAVITPKEYGESLAKKNRGRKNQKRKRH